jgi:tryptophan halogenase
VTADPVRKLVIVGGGTAGWMAAAAFARVMGDVPGLTIQLVESDAIGTVGVGEATVPAINLFNAMLGLDENELVRETHATYKLGIEFVDWVRKGQSYVHPFGTYGLDMLGIEFHQFWLRGRTLGDATPLDDYSIATVAGRLGRMSRPRPDAPNSPLSRIAYAFQFDATLYARFLRRRAEEQGVSRIEGRIVGVEQDPESGFVTAVGLESGARIEGDLFIDCSGFRSLLLGQTLGIDFTDWSEWLPCDRAVAIPCTLGGDNQPLTRATARQAGWQWRIPLQHRVGNGHVYCSRYMSDDEATAILLANLDGEPLADPNLLRFTGGYRKQAWAKNVVALGLAGGFLEPLESTSIYLIQVGIARLLTLFPDKGFSADLIARYNAQMNDEYVAIRDFLVLHYCATERDDSEFWNYCRNIRPPEGLARRLELFRTSGRVFHENNELFSEHSWLAVLTGQGIEARAHHPVALKLSDGETLKRLAHIRQVVLDSARDLPTQELFLRQQGSAIAPEMRKFALSPAEGAA